MLVLFQRKASSYNDALVGELISGAELKGFTEIERSRLYLSDETLNELYYSIYLTALTSVSVSYLFLHVLL